MDVSSTFDFFGAGLLSIHKSRGNCRCGEDGNWIHTAETRESVMPPEKTTSLYEFTVQPRSLYVSLGALTQLTVTQARLLHLPALQTYRDKGPPRPKLLSVFLDFCDHKFQSRSRHTITPPAHDSALRLGRDESIAVLEFRGYRIPADYLECLLTSPVSSHPRCIPFNCAKRWFQYRPRLNCLNWPPLIGLIYNLHSSPYSMFLPLVER